MGDVHIPARDIEGRLSQRVERGEIPGAVYHVERAGETLAEGAVGHAALEPERRAAAPDTLYDLASVTKAVSTALLAILAHREGALRLDTPLGRPLPGLRGSPWEASTVEDCLLHRAGLPAWAPLYCLAPTREEVPRAVAGLKPGSRGEVVYSDLGPVLVGLALERAWDRDLEALFRDDVAGPIGLDSVLFRPARDLLPRIAPTEQGNATERALALALPGRPCEGRIWPDRIFHGEPHDGNARFLGGAAGHAGLFGTARGLARLGREILGQGDGLLEPSERERLLRPFTPSGGEARCLFGQTGGAESPGSPLGAGAAGHTGFTGTSLFVEPGSGTVCTLLTNRVHPLDRPDVPMNEIRREFHRAAAALAMAEAGR